MAKPTWFDPGENTIISSREFPGIKVKERLKKVEIEGFSRMSNPSDYYEALLRLLENNFYAFNKTLIIDFRFDYINTSSMKWLFQMIRLFQKTAREGLVEINWYYEEDDEIIFETGELIGTSIDTPFHLKSIPVK